MEKISQGRVVYKVHEARLMYYMRYQADHR